MDEHRSPVRIKRRRSGKRKNADAKNEVLMYSIDEFYNDRRNFEILLNVLHGNRSSLISTDTSNDNTCESVENKKNNNSTKLSCRLLDYLAFTYSIEKQIHYIDSNGQIVHLGAKFQKALESYGKSLLDVFRRESNFEYKMHDETIVTTVGQLMFMKLAIEFGAIKYAYEHKTEIEQAMKMERRRKETDTTSKILTAIRKRKRRKSDQNGLRDVYICNTPKQLSLFKI